MEKWKENEPEDHASWLFRVCKNKAINHLRKNSTAIVQDTVMNEQAHADMEHIFLEHEIKDSQLRLLFASCDESISPRSQIILILKNLCGLKLDEISNALAMSEEAVMKSLTRSRHKLTSAANLSVPSLDSSRTRLRIVHTAIYLLFSEGYAATEGDHVIRRELCIEAMRLIKSILEIDQLRDHDTYALMALMCFHSARFEARINREGVLVELEKQDRSLWDKELIRLGIYYLKSAHDSNTTSRFVFEAAIASVHCVAETFEETNWKVIVGLYDRLAEIQSTPFVDMNRAVAVCYADGANAALDHLNKSVHQVWLKNYYLYYALLGKINSSLGDGLS
ncbi:MAG TPA: sigma-70 family RNA polymerase sigma factor, partial [Blastocatellia bacterium]|nr:sigma-70 family RNA polymerase sigma factor [Blastocatellia bacterium]